MHIADGTIRNMKLETKSHNNCGPCIFAKARHEPAVLLNHEYKDTPTAKDEILGLDILIPSKTEVTYAAGVKAMINLVDCYVRDSFVITVRKFDSIHLWERLLVLLVTHILSPRVIIADQQKAFASTFFQLALAKLGIRLKLVPRDRHSEFNGIVERNIGSLKAMARAGLVASHLDESFWPFAIAHACYVKNRIYHHSIKMSPYYRRFNRKPELGHLRKFGSLCYVTNALPRTNKFRRLATPSIFLGMTTNTFSNLTTITYNPDT